MDPLVGRTLDTKYLIEKLLGKGGMGSVYLALHTGTKRPVAVKVIAPQFMRNRELLIRFQREAEATGRLRHPNVVNVTDFGVTVIDSTAVAYLVMEYLDGETLSDFLQHNSPVNPALALELLEQITLGVSEAHSHGILHRDLKPHNIWLQPDGRGGYIVKVLDFGIAKLADPSASLLELPELEAAPNTNTPNPNDENATQVLAPTELGLTSAFAESSGFTTTVGSTLGTPAFMSPEQCCGRAVNEKSDLYSIAMMAYQMLAGELPFKGNARELLEKQINAIPDPPHLRNPKLSDVVSGVILESLDKDPDKRAPSPASFVTRLRAAIEGEVVMLRDSRAATSNQTGVWFAFIGLGSIPGGLLLSAARFLVGGAMERGQLHENLGFLLIEIFHAVIAYFVMIWSDLSMTRWLVDTRGGSGTIKLFFACVVRSFRDWPAALIATTFTTHWVRYALAHVVMCVEGKSVAVSRTRSEQLLKGNEHLAFALVVRRFSVAIIVALYIPLVVMLSGAPPGIVFREIIRGGFGGQLGMMSFGFLPVYGSFMPAWLTLYERMRRVLGEVAAEPVKRFDLGSGPVGQRIRLGTKIWGALPVLLILALIILPYVSRDAQRREFLGNAIIEGRTNDVKKAIARGDDLKTPMRGRTPLVLAVQTGNREIFELLIKSGAPLEPPPDLLAPLHAAVLYRRPEFIPRLLDLGANINSRDADGSTPLYYAATSGQVEIAKQLLARGADRTIKDEKERTPLDAARAEGYTELINLLEKP
jgi:serine/threonine protein kinase